MCGTFSQREDGRIIIDDWAQKDSAELKRKPLIYKNSEENLNDMNGFDSNAKFPGQEAWVLLNTTRDEVWLQKAKWGLIPHWAKSVEGFNQKTFNARSETVSELASFKEAYSKWRCAIPTEGYWEFCKNEMGKKERVKIYNPEGILWLVGIFSVRKNEKQPFSFTVLTSAPEERLAKIHHRKPMMFRNENEIIKWFDGTSFENLIMINEDELTITPDPRNIEQQEGDQMSFF